MFDWLVGFIVLLAEKITDSENTSADSGATSFINFANGFEVSQTKNMQKFKKF